MTRPTTDLLLFLLLGLLIGILMRTRENGSTPPSPKGAKTSKVWDTKDMARFKLGKAAGE